MKTLSIMVDESGDFGRYEVQAPYYLVTLVFHDQSQDIYPVIEKLNQSVKDMNFTGPFIHAGPIIRREREYADMTIDERRHLLYKMRQFYLHAPIKYATIKIDKRKINSPFEMNTEISKGIHRIIQSNLSFFQSFNKTIIYYDNGQYQLNMILNTVFSLELNNVEFRRATQEKYRLLQLADFICEFELLDIKNKEKRLSNSEQKFFYKAQELKKSFLKILNNKRII